jgi:hypothetical protein
MVVDVERPRGRAEGRDDQQGDEGERRAPERASGTPARAASGLELERGVGVVPGAGHRAIVPHARGSRDPGRAGVQGRADGQRYHPLAARP